MGGELRDKVASGVAWSLGEKLGTILLQMVVSIVVARLLMPDDVGLMALMTFFSSLALVVVDSGFSQMLIRKGDPAQGDYKSVFLFNVVVSWIVYGVLWQQDAENFVCMEPWNGWANSVNEEGRHEVLEPDEAMTSEWTITIEKV